MDELLLVLPDDKEFEIKMVELSIQVIHQKVFMPESTNEQTIDKVKRSFRIFWTHQEIINPQTKFREWYIHYFFLMQHPQLITDAFVKDYTEELERISTGLKNTQRCGGKPEPIRLFDMPDTVFGQV